MISKDVKIKLEPSIVGGMEPPIVPMKSILKSTEHAPDKVPSSSLVLANQQPTFTSAAAAASIAANTQIQKQQPKIDPNSLIYFSSHESLKLKYPVGCRVWYNLDSTEFDQGHVVDVALDALTRKFVYKIQNDAAERLCDLVMEDHVTYAMNCPVTIVLKGEAGVHGVVVGSNAVLHGGGKITSYCVQIRTETGRAKLVRGVKNIQYRHKSEVSKKDDKKAPEKVPGGPPVEVSKGGSIASPLSLSLPNPQQAKPSRLHPSVSNKRKILGVSDANSNANSNTMMLDKKQKVEKMLCLKIPSWTLNAGKDLPGMLEDKKRDIEEKLNGNITINFNAEGLEISIAFHSAVDENKERDYVAVFNSEVANLLTSYLNDSQSNGRLLFELAKHSSGKYKLPISSSGGIVRQSLAVDQGHVWMYLVEIPLTVSEDAKTTVDSMLSKISARYYGIYIYMAVPCLCNNYVLIYGKDPIKVGLAKMDVVRLIEAHERTA